MKGIDPGEKNITCERGQKRYYVLHEVTGLNFIVGTDNYVSSNDAFTFLQNLERKFILQYAKQWKTAHIYQMQQEFSPQIKNMIDSKALIKIEQIKENLEETQVFMNHTFEQALLRESKLSELEDRSTRLANGASEFERNAGRIRRRMWFEHYKYYIVGFCIIAGAIFLAIIAVCGGFSFSECKSKPKPTPTPSISPTPLPK